MVGLKTIDGKQTFYPIGTCFFARRKSDLFFITSKHGVNGYNTFNLRPTASQYDTIGFRYYNTDTKEICFRSLNVLDIKHYLPNTYFYDTPDFVVFKMNDPKIEKYINSLESYMFLDNSKTGELESLISIGYAFYDAIKFSKTISPTYYIGVLADSSTLDPYYPLNKSIYFVSHPKSIQGMSGAPVFGLYGYKRKKKLIKFGGVIFGSNDPFNSAYIVNPEIVESQVKDFLTAPR